MLLHKELYGLWVLGKLAGHVSARDAKDTMGISDNMKKDKSGPTNAPSTLPHYKPGVSYFYPSLKIHKMKRDQLVPGVEPPIRLITALHDGITKRSDIYISEHYLKDLATDFCADMLTDTTDALIWLEDLNNTLSQSTKKSLSSFTFDFKALYDSLNQQQVMEALKEAIAECRPDWSEDFSEWFQSLVNMSLKCSIGVFEDIWYRQKGGVPTGGTLCVHLANIAVYSIMRKAVYNVPSLMAQTVSVRRYIDDGAGTWSGNAEDFKIWLKVVNNNLSVYGLFIDEYCFKPVGEYVPFLDTQFCFDIDGTLQMDLYTKPTDSKSYLNFHSAHPNHTFTGIVYSQLLRLRRIINDDGRLKKRIDEFKTRFHNAKYPAKLVNDIASKVLTMSRSLNRKGKPSSAEVASQTPPIRLVSIFGSDDDIVKSVRKFEPLLSRTRSFSTSDSDILLQTSPTTHTPLASRSNTPPPAHIPKNTAPYLPLPFHSMITRSRSQSCSLPGPCSPSASPAHSRNSSPAPLSRVVQTPNTTPNRLKSLFQHVKRTGPSIRNRVVKVKNLALGPRFGKTTACNTKNCKCCQTCSDQESYKFNR